MGSVWNIILSFSSEEFWRDGEDEARTTCAALDALNKLLPPDGQLVDLTKDTFDASAGISAHVYGGGFKHFDLERFIGDVQAQAWRDPHGVELFLKHDSDGPFSLLRPCKPEPKRRSTSRNRTVQPHAPAKRH